MVVYGSGLPCREQVVSGLGATDFNKGVPDSDSTTENSQKLSMERTKLTQNPKTSAQPSNQVRTS